MKNDNIVSDPPFEECPICMENSINCQTECLHGYCKTCLKKINKCAICRKPINHRNIFKDDPDAENYEPSGSVNFSHLNNITLRRSLNRDQPQILNIRHDIYNSRLHVLSGMGGLAFSN